MPLDTHTRLIAVVSQAHFSHENAQFCKLVPLMYDNGDDVEPSDFLNDGEIWWMLTNFTVPLAIPGKLLRIEVEQAPQFRKDDCDSSMFQVRRDSPRNLNMEEPLEILEASSQAFSQITDLVDRDARVPVNHAPTAYVLLKWQGNYYGPFDTLDYDPVEGAVVLQPHRPDRTVACVAGQAFESRCAGSCRSIACEVSLSSHPRSRSIQKRDVRFQLLLPEGIETFLSLPSKSINLEAFEQGLTRMAKACLTRHDRQELRRLLALLRENVAKADDQQALLQRLDQAQALTERQERAFDEFAGMLVQTGWLGEERTQEAERRYAELYIQGHSAELQAEIEERIGTLRGERDRLDAQLASRKQQAETEFKHARLEQANGLRKQKDETDAYCRKARAEIAGEREKLDEERQNLQSGLKEAAELLRSSGRDVASHFVAMLPLLREVGILHGMEDQKEHSQSSRPARDQEVPLFAVPAVILSSSLRVAGPSEEEFFSQFRDYVNAASFNYRDVDLKRFHISVKCGDLTIVGGPSGIGKSSLAQLYGRALAGNEYDPIRPDFLMVNVRPSWMETADLIGHVNSLEQRFFPSETGLFQHLVCAAEELAAVGDGSAVYPVCLDEMNLAQVEHYFSDFLQIMERQLENRILPCFAEQTVGASCPFRKWPKVPISPAVRFIGTINVDETTRRLSDRLLDRANTISLRCDSLPNVVSGETRPIWPTATGPRITLADFSHWTRCSTLPTRLASLVDQLRPSLLSLGAPMTARSYQAICRYVASADPLLTPVQALDAQIAQRLLSKVRDLVTEGQRAAFQKLEKTIIESDIGAFDESRFALEQIRIGEMLQESDLGR